MTLVELLVAMTITVVITGLIIMSWMALSRSYANTVKRGEASDFARLAIDRMEREIRDAEQPPAVSEVAILRARPFSIVAYTTFNKSGNDISSTPPRLVMYRLYSNGELWRFQDADGVNDIFGVDINRDSDFLPPNPPAEGAQLMAANLVNMSTPSTSPASPTTPLFTYIYYNPDGTLARMTSVDGTQNRALIRAVEINLLIDMNPGRSPVYTHLRTTAQLRNTR